MKPIVLKWENPKVHQLEKTYRVKLTKVIKIDGVNRSPSIAGPLEPVNIECVVSEGDEKGLTFSLVASALEIPKDLKEGDSANLLIAKEPNVCMGIQRPPKPQP